MRPVLGTIMLSFFLAVVDVIDGAAATAGKIGTLGMQGLLAFMLVILFIVIWYIEKRRMADRLARDSENTLRFETIVRHHDTAVKNFADERSAFTSTLINLNQQSTKAMEGMTASINSLEQTLEYIVVPATRTHPKVRRKRPVTAHSK